LIEELQGRLIVSCQVLHDNPFMARLLMKA
jgi:putative N-acetylmannosamine-6-phosphate epimerase